MQIKNECMQRNAKAIIISSVSGGGKTTVAHLLQKRMPQIAIAITATTRTPRTKEKHTKDYYFYTHEEFLQKIEKGEFLEYAEVHNHYYGILAAPVMQQFAKGISVILNIDVQGMRTIKKKLGAEKIIDIFLMPPSEAIWKKRLQARGAITPEQYKRRLENGKKEMTQATQYTYILINTILEQTVNSIEIILKNNLKSHATNTMAMNQEEKYKDLKEKTIHKPPTS